MVLLPFPCGTIAFFGAMTTASFSSPCIRSPVFGLIPSYWRCTCLLENVLWASKSMSGLSFASPDSVSASRTSVSQSLEPNSIDGSCGSWIFSRSFREVEKNLTNAPSTGGFLSVLSTFRKCKATLPPGPIPIKGILSAFICWLEGWFNL